MLKGRKGWSLVSLSLAGAIIYRIPYIKDLFYVPLQETFKLTNGQIGLMLSLFGLINFLVYVPGGWIADKVSPKKLIVTSLIGTGIVGLVYATLPEYNVILAIHGILSFTSVFTYWASSIKYVRLMASSEDQGKIFGLWSGGKALGVMVFGILSVVLYNFTNSIQSVILLNSVSAILVGLFNLVVLEDTVSNNDSKRVSLQDMLSILKYKKIWYTGGLIFASFAVYIGFSLLNPYLSTFFGMSSTTVANLILALSLFYAGFAVVAGYLADKLKSSVKLMQINFVIMMISIVVFYFLPVNKFFLPIAIINMTILGMMFFGNQAVFFSTIDEIDIPEEQTGSAAGLISWVGYIPEIFLYAYLGGIVDRNPGLEGFKQVFVVIFICAFIGFASSILLRRSKKGVV